VASTLSNATLSSIADQDAEVAVVADEVYGAAHVAATDGVSASVTDQSTTPAPHLCHHDVSQLKSMKKLKKSHQRPELAAVALNCCGLPRGSAAAGR
jgi:hydroxymethylglutaryl-CoA reductase